MRMQHELLEPLDPSRLAECRDKIAVGYPDASHKLVLTPEEWRDIAAKGFVLPPGQWTIDNHPKRAKADPDALDPIYTAENPMSQEAIERWKRMGLRYDVQTGLPIHPRAEQLLTTPGLGMFTQVGSFYRPGPNPIANLGLRRVRNNEVEYAGVAVDRGKGGVRWSMPGGFYDPGKDPDLVAAGFREGHEEVGVRAGDIGGLVLRRYDDEPQYTWAATAHAWMQESYFFARSDSNPALEGYEELVPQDRAEIIDTAWLSLEDMRNPRLQFMRTHLGMILKHELHLETHGV